VRDIAPCRADRREKGNSEEGEEEEEKTEKNTPGDQESDRVKNRKELKKEEEEEEGVVSDALERVLLLFSPLARGTFFIYLFFPNLLCGFLVEPPFNIVKHKINK
jgi:hypothetical protein